MFSVMLSIFCAISIKLALEKDKENEERSERNVCKQKTT